ncbi:DUF3060 domain-containing protein [Curtobacterium sp. MCPF17_051]|uniref:DUF3060 domain-containing protein n=1 Tax=Curtobacterium sp. MCPF17_051 TaxID=2175640 RepID=UPI000DA74070|nr:DUF3060 domain-containing protein [Curtobacterium sp. MCPF17_051]PZF32990.1 hypothetical protein DEJ35_03315 [Curtobacterium sp. MCPF17_051]
MQFIKPITIATAALALATLAGCSAAETNTAKPSSTPSATSPAGPAVKKDVACKDGTAKVTDDSAELTVKGDCTNLEISASNSLVTVTGAVEHVSIAGAINSVHAKSVGSVTIGAGSNGNVVKAGNTPTVDDKGAQNEIAAE